MITIPFCVLHVTQKEIEWVTALLATSEHESKFVRVSRRPDGRIAVERDFGDGGRSRFRYATPSSNPVRLSFGASEARDPEPVEFTPPGELGADADPGLTAALLDAQWTFQRPVRREHRPGSGRAS